MSRKSVRLSLSGRGVGRLIICILCILIFRARIFSGLDDEPTVSYGNKAQFPSPFRRQAPSRRIALTTHGKDIISGIRGFEASGWTLDPSIGNYILIVERGFFLMLLLFGFMHLIILILLIL